MTSMPISSPPISISHRLFRCRYSNSRNVVASSASFSRPPPEWPEELARKLRCQVLTDHPLPGWALNWCVHTFSINSEAIHCFAYDNLLLPQRFKIASDKAKYCNSVESYIVYPRSEPHFYDVNTQDLSTRAPGVYSPIDWFPYNHWFRSWFTFGSPLSVTKTPSSIYLVTELLAFGSKSVNTKSWCFCCRVECTFFSCLTLFLEADLSCCWWSSVNVWPLDGFMVRKANKCLIVLTRNW